MKKILFTLTIAISLVACGGSKPAWHITSEGYYIYGEVSKKGVLSWEGSSLGCFAHGEGYLRAYDETGTEIANQALRVAYGVADSWQYVPCHSYFYLGEMDDDFPNGFGVKVDSDKYYIGYFKNGELYNGDYKIYLKQEDNLLLYSKGTLQRGQAYGVATYDKNGLLSYKGGMYKGQKNGAGVEYQDGTILYEGYFKRNLYHGAGKLYQNGTLIYDGEWNEGKRDGYGIQYDNELIIYKGEWENDVYDGKGILYKDGKYIEGKWDNGMLKKSILESTFNQIYNAIKMWYNPDSIQTYIENSNDCSNSRRSQMEFVQGLQRELQSHISETFSAKIEKRFGLWHIFRMIVQPWIISNTKRTELAERYFCRGIECKDLQNLINTQIDDYNKNNQGEELRYIQLPESIPQNTIVNANVATLVFHREAIETTDILATVILGILIFCVTFLIGFILGFLFGYERVALTCFIIDIAATIIAFLMGLYLSVFRTAMASIELENQLHQLMVENYMQFLESQNIINQILGML